MLSLKQIALAALLPASAIAVTVATIALPPDCAQAGTCGECYNTGRKGTLSWHGSGKGKYQECDPCAFTKPDLVLADYQPPDNGGPGKSGGTGTRHA